MSSTRAVSRISLSVCGKDDDKIDVQQFGNRRYSRLSLPNVPLRSSMRKSFNKVFNRDEPSRRAKSLNVASDRTRKRKSTFSNTLRCVSMIAADNDELMSSTMNVFDESDLENESLYDCIEIDESSVSQEESKDPHRRKFEFHYFWGSRTILQIYTALVVTILFRQFWLLHGVLLILLYRVLEKIFNFISHYRETEDYKGLSTYSGRVFKGVFGHLVKTVKGDVLKILFTRQAYKLYSKQRPLFVQSCLRTQMQRVNTATLSETRATIQHSDDLRRRNSHLLDVFE